MSVKPVKFKINPEMSQYDGVFYPGGEIRRGEVKECTPAQWKELAELRRGGVALLVATDYPAVEEPTPDKGE